MIDGKIAVLTSKGSWFCPFARDLTVHLNAIGCEAKFFNDHKKISASFKTVFILSYFRLIEEEFLALHEHNLVVHESALPKGRGWAPLFWQILEGRNTIPVVLFEATPEMDGGPVYLRDQIRLDGTELNNEIREEQARVTMALCIKFAKTGPTLNPVKQSGRPTYYKKRSLNDSKLNIRKSISEQFDLLRIVDNNEYPAFFEYKGYRYILSVRKENAGKVFAEPIRKIKESK